MAAKVAIGYTSDRHKREKAGLTMVTDGSLRFDAAWSTCLVRECGVGVVYERNRTCLFYELSFSFLRTRIKSFTNAL